MSIGISSPWATHSRELADFALSIAVRTDAYGAYTRNGGGVTKKRMLNREKLASHFEGRCTVGLHLVDPKDDTVTMIVWDFDNHDDAPDKAEANWTAARALVNRLERLGLHPLLEDTDGCGGYHVGIRWCERLKATKVRAWAKPLTPEGCELFPKQDRLQRGYGNWIRLPGMHHKRGHWSRFFVDGQWVEGPDAARALLNWKPSSVETVISNPLASVLAKAPAEQSTRAQERAKKINLTTARDCLSKFGPYFFDSYDRWIQIGMAFHHADSGPEMFNAWESWSRQSSKWKAGECEDKWQTFSSDVTAPITLGTLVEWAKNQEANLNHGPNQRYVDFPVDALPGVMQSLTKNVARAIGCDPAYVALPLLAILASAIGNNRAIRLKQGWVEPPIIWAVVIGESGTLKSPAMRAVLRAVRDVQQKMLERYKKECETYESDRLQYEKDLAAWKKDKADCPEKPEKPAAHRVIVSDVTVEAIAPILLENDRGVLLASDEIASWFGSFDRYAQSKGSDAAHWLSMHSAEPIIIDRKTGEPKTIFVPRPAVSITGGIQPRTLERVLGSEHRENGLLARLLLAWPPRRVKKWTNATVAENHQLAFRELLTNLYELKPNRDVDDKLQPVLIDLSLEAKEEWIKFYNAHAKDEAQQTGDLAAAWSKLEAYAARFALVFHFVTCASEAGRGDGNQIEASTVKAVVKLATWFKNETARIYARFAQSDEERTRQQLLDWIEHRGGSVTPREVAKGPREFRGKVENARKALQELINGGLGTWVYLPSGLKGGRPTLRFVMTPAGDETPSNGITNGGLVSSPPLSGSEINPQSNGSEVITTLDQETGKSPVGDADGTEHDGDHGEI